MFSAKELCYYCFEAIISYFNKTTGLKVPEKYNFQYPIFVTWEKYNQETGQYQLRGCIGGFSRAPLKNSIPKYSLLAAFHDNRFSPITQNEIPSLRCHLSILYDFEECQNYLDWVPGEHGLIVSYLNYSATYLPEVSIDHFNGDKEKTIKHLLRKAGYIGPYTDEIKKNLKLQRYKTITGDVTYQEYLTWKKENKE